MNKGDLIITLDTRHFSMSAFQASSGLWGFNGGFVFVESSESIDNSVLPNEEVSRRTGINNIVRNVKERRWRWLGHALRMNKTRHPRNALRLAPAGQRQRGRPMDSLRTAQMWKVVETWNEISWLAQDRDALRRSVGALCSCRGNDSWWWFPSWYLPQMLKRRVQVSVGAWLWGH